LAETYTFADKMFQTNQGPSYPAHQYIFSGTSLSNNSNLCNADNCGPITSAGCLAPPSGHVNALNITNSFPDKTYFQISGLLAQCNTHATLIDVLSGQNLTWKYYADGFSSIWCAPSDYYDLCQPSSADGKYDDTSCASSYFSIPQKSTTSSNGVIALGSESDSKAQVLKDIANGQLAHVTWIIPVSGATDHAGGGGNGPSWVGNIVNAIGANSTLWNNTAIFITWDDWGGWYDHVSPPINSAGPNASSYEYGFRVPLIIVSPYTQTGSICHQMADFGSILLFIEETFGLGHINGGGYADSYANDLSSCFDFAHGPKVFQAVKTRLGAQYFADPKNAVEEEPDY